MSSVSRIGNLAVDTAPVMEEGMPIRDERELEQAVQEFQKLRNATDGSPEGRRRADIDADIKAFYAANAESMRKGKPER